MIVRLNVGGPTRRVTWAHARARSAGNDCHLVAGMNPIRTELDRR
jgi:hypothetical protein